MNEPSITDLLNVSVSFKIANKDYLIKQLSIGEILSLAESEIRKTAMADANEMAKSLIGKDKVDFLRGILQDLPKGEKLRIACDEWLNTPTGISGLFQAAAKKANPEFKADMLASLLVSEENLGELALAVRYAIGGEGKDEIEKTTTEKKTEINVLDGLVKPV